MFILEHTRGRKKKSFLRRLISFFSKLLALAIVVGVGGYFYLDHWSQQTIALVDPVVVEFPSGTGLTALAHRLETSRVVDNGLKFRLWVRISGKFRKFQAGNYRFEGDVSPINVIAAIIEGKTYVPVVLSITVKEAESLHQLIPDLVKEQLGTERDLWALARDPKFLSTLKVPSTSLEGFIYPATYPFTKMPTAAEFFTFAVETFWKRLPADYDARAKALGLNLKQAVTLASLIEAESAHEDEKVLISEVIWARLKDRTPLGIDAALIYGIPNYDGDIRSKDLVDRSNPYNTRIYAGLPPTPIGSPSTGALAAALTPASFGNRFFVLIPDGSRRHHFSRTFAEHRKHVQELVKATQRPGMKQNSGSQKKSPAHQ